VVVGGRQIRPLARLNEQARSVQYVLLLLSRRWLQLLLVLTPSLATVHVGGDVLESVSAVLAGAVVWAWPQAKVADPLIAFLFAIIVALTTVYLMRDIYLILLDATPRDLDVKQLLRDLQRLQGVHCVSCLHVWQVAPGKICLTAKLHCHEREGEEEALRDANSLCRFKYGLAHTTIETAADENLLH